MSEAPRDKVAEEMLAADRFSGITADSYTPAQVRSARRQRCWASAGGGGGNCNAVQERRASDQPPSSRAFGCWLRPTHPRHR
jgi:hypothetical protein